MTLEQATANLHAAMQDYASTRKSLAHHRGLAKHGIANELAHAVAAEHSAFHRLERAQAAYAALQPAPVKPTMPVPPAPAPKPVVAPKTTEKPVPLSSHAAALAAYHTARRDMERARDAFQAADGRERQAHFAVIAARNNSQTQKD